MARCEDYPCCGHGSRDNGSPDCPTVDSSGREVWTCVDCGKRLPRKATSSICASCMRKARRQWAEEY